MSEIFWKSRLRFVCGLLFVLIFSGCQNGLSLNANSVPKLDGMPSVSGPFGKPGSASRLPPDDRRRIPSTPRPYKIDALIYQGVSTAFGDAEAIVDILGRHGLTYRIYNSEQFNTAPL